MFAEEKVRCCFSHGTEIMVNENLEFKYQGYKATRKPFSFFLSFFFSLYWKYSCEILI